MSSRSFDKISVLRSRGIVYRETNAGELNFHCPFCTDRRWRFFWNRYSGKAYCHNCEFQGSIFGFLSKFLGISYDEAQEMVESESGAGGWYKRAIPKEKVSIDYPPFFRRLEWPATKDSKPFWDYVTNTRELPVDRVVEFGLGYCRNGVYGGRVVIPVFWDNVLVNWVARTILPVASGGKKVLTPPYNNQSKYLYNLDKLWGKETIVLVEGPFDMLKIPDLAVASFGKRLHDAQFLLLKKSGAKHIVVCYDNDAKKETYNTAKKLSEMFRVSVVDMPTGEDPGSLNPVYTRALINDAKPFERRIVWR
jgi:DNA primase